MAPADVGVEAGVVRQRGDTFAAQPRGGLLDLPARLAVHDAGIALVPAANEAQQLPAGVVLLDHRVADVRAIEAADEQARVLQLQPQDDVGAGQRVGGGGEREARHPGVASVQQVERQVVLAEIVAPLADAVRLVDREQAEEAALLQRIELGQHARRGQPLGGDVEQGQPAAHQLALDPLRLPCGQRRVEERRRHAGLVERADLVVHQRDQRAHHHGHAASAAVQRDRGHLVAQALAAAGGHQHQRVAAREHVVDDGGLRTAKCAVAEDVAQDRGGSGGGGGGHGSRRRHQTKAGTRYAGRAGAPDTKPRQASGVGRLPQRAPSASA